MRLSDQRASMRLSDQRAIMRLSEQCGDAGIDRGGEERMMEH